MTHVILCARHQQGDLTGSVYGQQGNDTFDDVVILSRIYGGAGDDSLETTVINGFMGQLGFEGGEGSNSLRISGGGSGYTAQQFV